MTNGCEDCGNDQDQGVSVESAAFDVVDAVSEFTEAVTLIQEAIAGIDGHTADLKSGIDSQVATAQVEIASVKSDITALVGQVKTGLEQNITALVKQAIQDERYFVLEMVEDAMRRRGY